MQNFYENNLYDPLFSRAPENPSISEQAEQLSADIEKLKTLLEKADDLLKNGKKISPGHRLKLEKAVVIYSKKLNQEETRFLTIATQHLPSTG